MLVLFSHLLSNSGNKRFCARVSSALGLEWQALSSEERKNYPKEGKNPESRKRKRVAKVTPAEDEYHRNARRRKLWGEVKKLVTNLG